MSAHILDVTAVKPSDGFDHWHQVTCRDFSRTECRRTPQAFRARIAIRRFGALHINDIWSATPDSERIHVTRSPQDISKDPRDYFMLWLSLGGETILSQCGRAAPLHPGDMVLHDQSQPFALEFGPRARAMMVSIPRPLLTARLSNAETLAARAIPRASKLGALCGSFIRHMTDIDDVADTVVERLSQSALDMFATTLESELVAEAPRGDPRLERAKTYICAHLHDPDLDLETIAKAQNMAPRTLNRLFAAEATTPIRWLWQQRLTLSYRALSEGKVQQVTDAALTYGFSDLSHFSRAFKAAFGKTPHEVKRR
ncbi:helix-turn-helix domain-containing protein [Methylocella sp. CPCC 101449]|uniref:helix-turn-helix domain-containing protein n=1 Tax=Methylocella sp. CPCC 101449 TaxID=2987531 RepID=UPI00288CF286|nr:helix-turn-helix domain-containing protein [Methylocella sp. CPCC 101449]MDT2022515.1 helix-turn-helix domain-containing protein [Methylocella sp. CPCC 101449]